MVKYPKTPRLAAVLESELALWRRSTAVVEEKVDGANAAIHFSGDGLVLQSRGHVLSGGLGEAQFDRLKSWGAEHEGALRERLGVRYVVFGEWCYAKHRPATPARLRDSVVSHRDVGCATRSAPGSLGSTARASVCTRTKCFRRCSGTRRRGADRVRASGFIESFSLDPALS